MIKRASGNFRTTVFLCDEDGAEWAIEVDVEWKGYSDPGRVSGPWEDCYPPEGEMEILSVKPVGDVPAWVTDDLLRSTEEQLIEEAWEEFDGDGYDG